MKPLPIVHCLSGGLDSVTMLWYLHRQTGIFNIHCVLFDYGQRHCQELAFARQHCHDLGVLYTTICIPKLRGSQLTDGEGSWVVPFRNSVMLSHALNLAAAAKAEQVTIACNRDDASEFHDCSPSFFIAMNQAVVAAGLCIEICVPFIDHTKKEIVALARKLQVPIEQTWSCYRGGKAPCGTCLACIKRSEALA